VEIEHKQGEAARLAAIARVAITKGLGGDAARLREALQALGPTFVKFGQMISQREDLFQAPLVAELRSLQDRAATFPAAQARQIIEQRHWISGRRAFRKLRRRADGGGFDRAGASRRVAGRHTGDREGAAPGDRRRFSASQASRLPACWALPGPRFP
jgi:hypothetical protein